jgi:hypothetical protein
MTGAVPKPANSDTPRQAGFENAVDVLAGLMTFARVLRADGWEVNLAIETGGVDRINFSAQRGSPQ